MKKERERETERERKRKREREGESMPIASCSHAVLSWCVCMKERGRGL